MKHLKHFENLGTKYNGNIYDFLNKLNNEDVEELLGELDATDDLDDRMSVVDQILSIIEEYYEEYYDLVEDDIKDLTL